MAGSRATFDPSAHGTTLAGAHDVRRDARARSRGVAERGVPA
jgi:hypothetical protein